MPLNKRLWTPSERLFVIQKFARVAFETSDSYDRTLHIIAIGVLSTATIEFINNDQRLQVFISKVCTPEELDNPPALD